MNKLSAALPTLCIIAVTGCASVPGSTHSSHTVTTESTHPSSTTAENKPLLVPAYSDTLTHISKNNVTHYAWVDEQWQDLSSTPNTTNKNTGSTRLKGGVQYGTSSTSEYDSCLDLRGFLQSDARETGFNYGFSICDEGKNEFQDTSVFSISFGVSKNIANNLQIYNYIGLADYEDDQFRDNPPTLSSGMKAGETGVDFGVGVRYNLGVVSIGYLTTILASEASYFTLGVNF